MPNWNQGFYTPKNPEKYIGKTPIKYRSAWELTFCNVCDNHPNIVQWASESLRITYINPLTGKQTVYIPDFLVIYVDKYGNKQGEIIEIKPSKETTLERAQSKRDKYAVALNTAKWEAAQKWAQRNGLKFRVMTEEHLYQNSQSPKLSKSPGRKKKK